MNVPKGLTSAGCSTKAIHFIILKSSLIVCMQTIQTTPLLIIKIIIIRFIMLLLWHNEKPKVEPKVFFPTAEPTP